MAADRGATISTVIFDYGGVLSRPQPSWARATMERLAGVPGADFWAAYWAERPRFDTGVSAAEFWDRIARRVGADWDTRTDPGRVQALWTTDIASWLEVSPDSAALVGRLARSGTRLALLSNAPHDLAGVLRHSPLLAPFDTLVFTCDLGACKPDPAVYTHVLARLGAAPEETAFIDDREENVLAAKRLGIDAHPYSGTGDLVLFLTDRVRAF